MRRIILVTGGARSGKSSHALRLARSQPSPRAFIATCPPVDEEMREKIRHHREERNPDLWKTIEEETDLKAAIGRARDFPVILVDCLTLWVYNLMQKAEKEERELNELEMARVCRETIRECRNQEGTILFVTNEIGMGIVPEEAVSRRFRDLVGRCNQTIADEAHEVIFLVSGQPLHVKGERDESARIYDRSH